LTGKPEGCSHHHEHGEHDHGAHGHGAHEGNCQ
jgi:hypothetical protein